MTGASDMHTPLLTYPRAIAGDNQPIHIFPTRVYYVASSDGSMVNELALWPIDAPYAVTVRHILTDSDEYDDTVTFEKGYASVIGACDDNGLRFAGRVEWFGSDWDGAQLMVCDA